MKTNTSGKLLTLLVIACAQPTSAQVTRTFTEPYEQIELSAAESGIIAQIPVREGQPIKADGLIGKLDCRVLVETLRLAKQRAQSTAKIDGAVADLKLKQKIYKQLEPLLRNGSASPTEVERAATELSQAQANLRIARDEAIENTIEVDRISAQIAQREIRSPIDGIVLQLHRKRGEYVSTSKAEFATIVQLSRLRARFFVTTKHAKTLRTNGMVMTRIGDERKRVSATVEFISPVTDSQSGTVRVDVVIDNIKGDLRSGVLCELVSSGDKIETPKIGSRSAPKLPPRRPTQAMRLIPGRTRR